MNETTYCPICGYPLDEKEHCICCIEEKILEDCEWFLEHNSEVILNVDDCDWLLHKAREAIRLARENAKLESKVERALGLIDKKTESNVELLEKIEELEQWKTDAMSNLGYNTDYSKKRDETDRLKYKIEQLQETLQFAINNPDFISSNSDDFKIWKNSYCSNLLIPEK